VGACRHTRRALTIRGNGKEREDGYEVTGTAGKRQANWQKAGRANARGVVVILDGTPGKSMTNIMRARHD